MTLLVLAFCEGKGRPRKDAPTELDYTRNVMRYPLQRCYGDIHEVQT